MKHFIEFQNEIKSLERQIEAFHNRATDAWLYHGDTPLSDKLLVDAKGLELRLESIIMKRNFLFPSLKEKVA